MQLNPKGVKYNYLTFISAPLLSVLLAGQVHAGMISDMKDVLLRVFLKEDIKVESSLEEEEIPVLKTSKIAFSSSTSVDTDQDDEGVMKAVVGQMRSSTEEEKYENDQIAVYEVKQGDTVATVADLFGVSKNTIIWANDIKGALKPGDVLIVLPVTGVKHVIKKGDTLASIAKKYKADLDEIALFNGVSNTIALVPGESIIIPEGEIETPKVVAPKKKIYNSSSAGYYSRPLMGGVKTQGIHGHNAVDIGTPVGTPILAAADGTVAVARDSGYNGGYGDMIIINHPNGTQTVYGHLSKVSVKTGQRVVKGEQIGSSGNTGRSTGPHLHFEIRGATNPF